MRLFIHAVPGVIHSVFSGFFTDKCLVIHRIGTILVNYVLMGGAREELLVT